MTKYIFNDEQILAFKNSNDADPQVIGEALDEVRSQNKGVLTPESVWQVAQDKKSALHRHFEWDVQKAAESHWRQTARLIISAVRIVNRDTESGSAPAFVSIAAANGRAYYSVSDVRRSADMTRILLESAERDLDAFERRYRELKDICAIVGNAKAVIRQKREQTESRKAA